MQSKWHFLILLTASIINLLKPTSALAIDLDTELSTWMRYVNDGAILSDLTIPGTHDSGAMHESVAGTAKTQNLTIGEQLNIGVRYLDIRLRHYGDAFVVHHGSVYQHLNFDDVLTQVTAFLAENPSEVVIMEVSEEYTAENTTRTFEETFVTYTDNSTYSSYWWRHSYVPAMGDVRGKIVLLRRFSGSFRRAGGIDVRPWQDNDQFTLYDTRGVAINVQDFYQINLYTNDDKWEAILDRLSAAQADGSGTLFLNFTSGYRSILGIPNIPSVSGDINERLVKYFQGVTASNVHHGIVISDFISEEMVKEELRPFFY